MVIYESQILGLTLYVTWIANVTKIFLSVKQSSNSHQTVIIVTYRAVAGTGAGSALAYFKTNLAAILPILVAIGLIESIAS